MKLSNAGETEAALGVAKEGDRRLAVKMLRVLEGEVDAPQMLKEVRELLASMEH